MPIWLIPVAVSAALSALGCGRIGFEESTQAAIMKKDAGPGGDKSEGAADAGSSAYSSNCSPDSALQRLCTGVDGGK